MGSPWSDCLFVIDWIVYQNLFTSAVLKKSKSISVYLMAPVKHF